MLLTKGVELPPMLRGISYFDNVMNKIVIALGGNASIQWDVKGIRRRLAYEVSSSCFGDGGQFSYQG
jgi:hypothetical protein